MIKDDGLHYSFRRIDGFSKLFNLIISSRDDGKTTSSGQKIVSSYERGLANCFVLRYIADLTDLYVATIEALFNTWSGDGKVYKITYKAGEIQKGIVEYYVNGKSAGLLISLSIPLQRLKRCFYKARPIANMFMDEYIVNPIFKEKYLAGEFMKIKELTKTLQKDSPNLRWYFLGNPYSLYNPFVAEFEISSNVILANKNKILTGNNWLVDYHELNPVLKEKLLNENPLYREDDAYKEYALSAKAINDINFRIKNRKPNDYSLDFVIRFDNRIIGYYISNSYDFSTLYWCGYLQESELGKDRTILCFDFNSLMEHTIIVSNVEKLQLRMLKNAIRTRAIEFETLELGYLTQEIYGMI